MELLISLGEYYQCDKKILSKRGYKKRKYIEYIHCLPSPYILNKYSVNKTESLMIIISTLM